MCDGAFADEAVLPQVSDAGLVGADVARRVSSSEHAGAVSHGRRGAASQAAQTGTGRLQAATRRSQRACKLQRDDLGVHVNCNATTSVCM